MTSAYWLLALAIIAEVIATLSLKATQGFTQWLPSVAVIVGYGVAFICLSIVVKTIPLGLAYAIWTGIGTVLITLFAAYLYQQALDLPAIIGMSLIVAGVIVIQLFSKTAEVS